MVKKKKSFNFFIHTEKEGVFFFSLTNLHRLVQKGYLKSSEECERYEKYNIKFFLCHK